MTPVLLLLVGMLVVVGSILFLRLHAFLALVLGSLVVAGLTEKQSVFQYSLRADGIRVVVESNEKLKLLVLKATKNQKIVPGSIVLFEKILVVKNLRKLQTIF